MTMGRSLVCLLLLVSAGGVPASGGEPARLVFRDARGRELTVGDLEGLTGTVAWEVVGAAGVSALAKQRHAEGRAAGERGETQRALALFAEAHRLAPRWPYPLYDAAFTHLLAGANPEALAEYRAVDRLAPRGFFAEKSELDCLQREAKSELPTGFCRAFAMLEWVEDRAQKRETLEGIVSKFPRFAPAWQQLGQLVGDEKLPSVLERGLAAHPDAETKGALLLARALWLERRGERNAALRLLGTLALDPESTLATEHLAKLGLANLGRSATKQ
jgi:tetratricopeptide (TPR) repeat protein